ncbi:DUF1565 domain-containing protein [Echinicola soli]|uniref:DUF1565 domain-containing protein n=1 Tax=Echinicola soli TaxID=2591634 RepID=A0A514CMI3_9BACT|nr:right-handed parallel beta-helix repeat-containing protein [Echinicola soli]QDH81035.1 DUF1565 domain-containing protein [Echinicola soli]
MIKYLLSFVLFMFLLTNDVFSQNEIHVSVNGNDRFSGSNKQPLKTISEASNRAMPGGVVIVHAGVYREQINPPRGGISDSKRITYRTAGDGQVEIKGSERIQHWMKVSGDVWKVELPNSFFGDFNPYKDSISGDWFHRLGRVHHTGAVYREGHWLAEAASLEDVLGPVKERHLWFGKVDDKTTSIWAQFPDYNPNSNLTEINVRQTIFYPEKTGINYITLSGFHISHAATNWAPPTAEQKGAIGTNWSKGWIIENNTVRYSKCTGITLGKYGDEYDNTSEDKAEGYVETIKRALKNGWNRDNIGHHIVRNNTISHCEQAGMVGSMGCSYSTIENNHIYDIHVDRLFSGYEMAAIKFHGPIDTQIRGNYIHHTILGIWLDWMTQGTRVSSNLLHDNERDMFFEVNHGPYLVDNNISLGEVSIHNWSQGGAFVHNLIAGEVKGVIKDKRLTPYFEAHDTRNMTLASFDKHIGDQRFFNNVFINTNLSVYDTVDIQQSGNVFMEQSKPLFSIKGDSVTIHTSPFTFETLIEKNTKPVTTEMLGKTTVSGLLFEHPDGSPLKISQDYFGNEREVPIYPGPFNEELKSGTDIKVWTKY